VTETFFVDAALGALRIAPNASLPTSTEKFKKNKNEKRFSANSKKFRRQNFFFLRYVVEGHRRYVLSNFGIA
jgi:hypothetical protein